MTLNARKTITPLQSAPENPKLRMMPKQLFPRSPILAGDNVEAKREEIRKYFHATLDRYEQLFETLRGGEAYYKKPISLRHPLIFYLGHTSTFFTNKLLLAGLITERIDPRLESMFAVGVDEMSWDDLNTTHYDWPSIEEVRLYRTKVRDIVDRLIRETPLTLPIGWDSPWWTIVMGIEHERIHLETSSVLIRQHALQYVIPHPAWEPYRKTGPAPENQLIDISEGTVHLGKNKSDPVFGWDNEYGSHVAEVAAFQAGKYLVSNQEFLGFVQANGYGAENYWEEEGRAWRRHRLEPADARPPRSGTREGRGGSGSLAGRPERGGEDVVAQRGELAHAAQATQGARLDLAHAFAGDPELPGDLDQRAGEGSPLGKVDHQSSGTELGHRGGEPGSCRCRGDHRSLLRTARTGVRPTIRRLQQCAEISPSGHLRVSSPL